MLEANGRDPRSGQIIISTKILFGKEINLRFQILVDKVYQLVFTVLTKYQLLLIF